MRSEFMFILAAMECTFSFIIILKTMEHKENMKRLELKLSKPNRKAHIKPRKSWPAK